MVSARCTDTHAWLRLPIRPHVLMACCPIRVFQKAFCEGERLIRHQHVWARPASVGPQVETF
eukprot:7799913-Alexandrium_andersonii.AAC.1